MNRKDTEKAIADNRAVTAERVRYTLTELLADAEASATYPLQPEEREWVMPRQLAANYWSRTCKARKPYERI